MTVKKQARRFELHRDVDETGVSGTGVVAQGIEFGDGCVALRWLSAWPTSVVFHDRGMEAVEKVHGHAGKTRIVYLEDEEGTPLPATVGEIAKAVNQQVRAASEAAGQWTLGQLIDALAKRDPEQVIWFDFADFLPDGVESYRGHYDQLALNYRKPAGGYPTVGNVIEWLTKAIGATFEGYKGGRYTMSRDTMLWVANFGEAGGTAVVGLYDDITWVTMIRTAHVG